jgi:hypothetical protein
MLKLLPSTHENALLLCVRYVTPKCIKELLAEYKLDFSITDLCGNSVLHLIMMREHGEEDKIKVLNLFHDNAKWYGMSLNAQNDKNQTVLDLNTVENSELESYLVKHGAKRSELVLNKTITQQFDQYAVSSSLTPTGVLADRQEMHWKKRRYPL